MPASLPLLALAQALGLVAADRLGIPSRLALLVGIEALLAGFVLAHAARTRLACAALVCFAAGAAALSQRLEEAALQPITTAVDAEVEATVVSSSAAAIRVSLELRDVVATATAGPALPARVKVSEERDGPATAWLLARSPGERVRLRLRLRPVQATRNPGRSNDGRSLARRGIGARATLLDSALAVRRSDRDAPWSAAPRAVAALRRALLRRLAAAGPRSALLRALALGDRAGLTADQTVAVARLGLAHLLAVSGLHLAITAALAYAAARRLQGVLTAGAPMADLRRRALLVAAGAATVYAGLTGAGVPVQRALVFVWAAVAGVGLARRIPASHVLAVAGMVILAFDPAALFELGPQLSFAATAALFFASRRVAATEAREESEPSRARRLLALLDASCIALAVTAPLLAQHAMASGAAGLVANGLAIPWTAAVLLPASLLAAAAAALPASAAGDVVIAAAGWIAAVSVDAAVAVADWLPPLPQRPPPAAWASAAAALLAAACLASRRSRTRLFFTLCVLLWLRAAPVPTLRPLPPRLVAFDVGQGDASLVQGRHAALLIDGGHAMSGGLDLGRSIVLPALAALEVERLDLMVASHGDVDHAGGLVAVLAALPVGELWLPAGAAGDEPFAALRARARARGVPVREIARGAPPRRFGDLEVTVLWPPPDGPRSAGNEGSLALRVEVEGQRLLFVGDLGFVSEARLLGQPGELAADVFKVAHHGSAGSSSSAFLRSVAPAVALVSASCGGRARLPDRGTLARLRDAGAAVWWTGRDGAVLVSLAGETPAPVVLGSGPTRDCGP